MRWICQRRDFKNEELLAKYSKVQDEHVALLNKYSKGQKFRQSIPKFRMNCKQRVWNLESEKQKAQLEQAFVIRKNQVKFSEQMGIIGAVMAVLPPKMEGLTI